MNLEQIEQARDLGKVIETSPKSQQIQCKNICITINNHTLEQKSKLLDFFKTNCDKYIAGEEIGNEGTHHIQGAFVLTKKDRFSSIFKRLGFNCHLEKMKGNWKQQISYCSKENKVFANYSIDSDDQPLDCLKEEQLFNWQKDILTLIKTKPNNRTINWFWEDTGNVGKTEFTRYLGINHNACIIQKGKYADIMNHVFMTKNIQIFIVDIPRCVGNKVSYDALESIKSGIIFNSKYETGQKFINSPHIIVFSNEPPDESRLSADRWNIVNIPGRE
nr:MAG: replication associated protein [Cressdnaviricota sp.]